MTATQRTTNSKIWLYQEEAINEENSHPIDARQARLTWHWQEKPGCVSVGPFPPRLHAIRDYLEQAASL